MASLYDTDLNLDLEIIGIPAKVGVTGHLGSFGGELKFGCFDGRAQIKLGGAALAGVSMYLEFGYEKGSIEGMIDKLRDLYPVNDEAWDRTMTKYHKAIYETYYKNSEFSNLFDKMRVNTEK